MDVFCCSRTIQASNWVSPTRARKKACCICDRANPCASFVCVCVRPCMTAMNAVVRRCCNARTSFVEVFRFFARTIENQADRAALRSAQLHLPHVAAQQLDALWFGERVVGPMRCALGKWPFTFTKAEMGAAALFCAGDDNALHDGTDRTEALGCLLYTSPSPRD